jgi:hypothetical protein
MSINHTKHISNNSTYLNISLSKFNFKTNKESNYFVNFCPNLKGRIKFNNVLIQKINQLLKFLEENRTEIHKIILNRVVGNARKNRRIDRI